jgi:ribonuclease P protein subunit RPR2
MHLLAECQAQGEMSIVVLKAGDWRVETCASHRCFRRVFLYARIGRVSTERTLPRQRDNGSLRQIAEERVDILLRLAKDAVRSDPSLSKRYVELAQRIAMRSGVRLGPQRKQFICKNCKSLLVPGINCRVRVRAEHGTHVVVTCLECGSAKRYPAVKEKRLKRRR